MSAFPDGSGAVRPGEALPVAAVDAWLKSLRPELTGLPTVTQFPGGASNWTYRLAYPEADMILRRPPAGTKAKSAHDMGREFRVQAALQPVFPTVPTMVGLCTDPSVMDCDFYVMTRVPGLILRKNPPKGLTLDPATTRRLCENVMDGLAVLHAVDADAVGLTSLGKGPGYCRRQITGWSDRYVKALTWNVPKWQYVRDWLRERIPDDVATCLIHGDWRLDNVVLADDDVTRLVAVLDWEMATLGDPLMDLGNSLAYWVQADDPAFLRATRRQASHLPGMLTRQEIIDRYLDKSGLGTQVDARDFTFYQVYGLFRLAVIAQQIYYRYHHKQTRNPAFRHLWVIIHYLHWRCQGLIRQARK